MGWANKLIGWATGNGAEVTANNRLLVSLGDATTQASQTSSIREFSEVDSGAVTGSPLLMSPEADEDFRQRTAIDILRDEENFNYTTQNTGKHAYANTTMTNAWSVGAMTTNSGSIVTTTTGTSFGSYACFPIYGTNTLSFDIEASFSAQPTANTVIDFGGFLRDQAGQSADHDEVDLMASEGDEDVSERHRPGASRSRAARSSRPRGAARSVGVSSSIQRMSERSMPSSS